MRYIIGFFKILSNFLLFYYLIQFIKFYLKGLVHPKWFWAFWLNIILAIFLKYKHDKESRDKWAPYENKTGAQIWEESQSTN